MLYYRILVQLVKQTDNIIGTVFFILSGRNLGKHQEERIKALKELICKEGIKMLLHVEILEAVEKRHAVYIGNNCIYILYKVFFGKGICRT